MKMNVSSSGEEWIYKTGAGYDWFSKDATQTLDSKIKSGQKYNLIINMGVNDLGNVSKYITLYKKMTEQDKYKDCNFIIFSVNPIKDDLAKKNGYSAKNSEVINFNARMKKEMNNKMTYCDTYSHIKETFSTEDGLHYNKDTYQEIYDYIKKRCL